MASTTSRIRVFDRTRRSRSSSPRLGNDCIKWPLTNDAPGSPLSPVGNRTTVGPSGPLLLRGTISTVSLLSLRFLPSSETTSTQCRTGGDPRFAVQISPRLGETLAVNVYPHRTLGQRRLQRSFLRGFLLGQFGEIIGSVIFQPLAVLEREEPVDRQINRLRKLLSVALFDQPLDLLPLDWSPRAAPIGLYGLFALL